MKDIIQFKNASFEWIDLVAPTPEELDQLAMKYHLHSNLVKDCLDPEHLPKIETLSSSQFLILRVYDKNCDDDADDVQELTRKIAVFFSDSFVITIHRKPQEILFRCIDKWKQKTEEPEPLSSILNDIIEAGLKTYEAPIDEALLSLERLEMAAFEVSKSEPFDLVKSYYLKRRASVFRRILKMTMELMPRLNSLPPSNHQNLKEEAESLLFYADELLEGIHWLLSLHISLSNQKTTEASHQTGEIVRILTIFSVFLLPLNVITGIYGMNFELMPELKWPFGYFYALGLMALVLISVFYWFRRKGWLK